jgi:uncharacterized protein YndB with AHSA1/START domain
VPRVSDDNDLAKIVAALVAFGVARSIIHLVSFLSKSEVFMRSLKLICLTGYLMATGSVLSIAVTNQADGKSDRSPSDQTLVRLSRLVGGTWISEDPKFVVEFRYEWSFNDKAIRGLGVIDKGGPHETPAEVILGWDQINKTVYYLDCHGGSSIFKGTVKLEGENLVFEFSTLIGTPATWREVLSFPNENTMQFTIFGEKEGKWAPVVTQTSKRRQTVDEAGKLVTEGIIKAPVDAVWAAFTTKEGQESWNVAHAEIELKVGGKMRTHYDQSGRIGDPNTIENTILCFEPKRMLAIQVANAPEKFPYKNAIKNTWTVLYFEDVGQSRTRLTLVGLGYGNDDESRKLRNFFDKGNSYTVKKLQEKFADKKQTPMKGE